MLHGYRYKEVPLARIGTWKPELEVSEPRAVDLTRRPVVQTSLGCHFEGAACPHPCPQDPFTMVAGVLKRVGCQPPEPEEEYLNGFSIFVRNWLETNLKPLSPGVDTSFETWIDGTNYPEWRRQELRDVWDKYSPIMAADNWWLDPNNEKLIRCKSFMKDETYPEYKHARGINSRHDALKCKLGPIFKLIEKELFQLPWFIKKVPVADRPAYIMDRLYREGSVYIATDYTAFEALIRKRIMEVCEIELYRYMTQFLAERWFLQLCLEVIARANHCSFRTFAVKMLFARMSGEMCTSLGNGFTNLMLMLYTASVRGCNSITGVVEGDDGLFRLSGSTPTTEDFEKLGMIIKLEVHNQLSHASFCGLIFDPEDLVNVTDPRKVVCNFGWASRQYSGCRKYKRLRLLRCKALSLAHQYPRCPIIMALARYGLSMTRGVHGLEKLVMSDFRLSSWERERMLSYLKEDVPWINHPCPLNTRMLIEKKYGIGVGAQILFEEYLDSKLNDPEPTPIDFPLDLLNIPSCWQDYYIKYGRETHRLDPKMEFPFFDNRTQDGWEFVWLRPPKGASVLFSTGH